MRCANSQHLCSVRAVPVSACPLQGPLCEAEGRPVERDDSAALWGGAGSGQGLHHMPPTQRDL